MMKNICLIVFLVITLDRISSQKYYNLSYIFPESYCNVTCRDEVHTLCKPRRNNCRIAESIIPHKHRREMKRMLILGHNGLRNRIAERMHVANMVELVWHDDLALMADTYIFQCQPFQTDPCALYTEQDLFNSHTYVVQNRYIQVTAHYPNILIENALRSWYLDRDKLKPPKKIFNESQTYMILKNENNFTHLASPKTYNFGCGFRQYHTGYILICNYHPYVRNADLKTYFMFGDPGSLCPITHPLRNTRESFANLCVNARRNKATGLKLHIFGFVIFYINGLFTISNNIISVLKYFN